MSRPLFTKTLSENEIAVLNEWINSDNREQMHRAKTILYSASGKTAYEIGSLLNSHPDNLKKWIREFNKYGIEGISVHKRGPQGKFTDDQVTSILELYKQSPRQLGLKFDYWTPQKLADECVIRRIIDSISHVTMRHLMRTFTDDTQTSDVNFDFIKHKDKGPSYADSNKKNNDLSPIIEKKYLQDFVTVNKTELDFAKLQTYCETLIKQGNYAVICELLNELLTHKTKLFPEVEAKIRCWLSQSLEELGRYEESLTAVQLYENPSARNDLEEKIYAQVRLRLGMAYARTGNLKSIARLNESLRIFIQQEDYENISAAHYGLGFAYCEINEFRIAHDHLRQALDYEQLIKDKHLLARIYLTYGVIKFNEGSYEDATKSYQKSLLIAQQTQDPLLLGFAFLNLGEAAKELGKPQLAVEYRSKALEEFKKCGEMNLLVRTYNNMADGLMFLGKWHEANLYVVQAIELADRINSYKEKSLALITKGELNFFQGNLIEAEETLNESLNLLHEGDRWFKVYIQCVLSQIFQVSNRIDAAFKTLRSALQIATSVADIQNVYRCHLCLAELHFSQEGYDQAEEYLELAKEQIKLSQDLTAQGHLQRLEGQVAAVRGRLAEAQQHVESSISIFKTLEDKYKLALSHFAMVKILSQVGEFDSARSFAFKAQKAFSEMGASIDLDKANLFLEQLNKQEIEFTASSSDIRFQVVGHTGGVSDLLLIQRIIEASTSRELLFQELTSIFINHFDIQRAVIWEVRDHSIQPVIGIKPQEANQFTQFIAQALANRRSLSPGHLVHILEDRTLFRTVLWLESKLPDKSFDLERIKPYLKQIEMGLDYASLRSQSRSSSTIETSHSRTYSRVPGFIYSSPAMCQLIERIQKIRTSDVTVLITGESGTGKELIARAVHAESGRRGSIFLPFNCSTTPREMIDSQLFGHRRGSFTGASANYAGMIKAADGGTLFLDEIGDMALEVQPKLLRFLQEGEIQPLGEVMPSKVDVRVIAATNIDLERAVEEGKFREDFFHRLNIIRLPVPPLRDRREEIPLLAAYYLEHFSTRDSKRNMSFSREALHALSQHNWPGNVRQLCTEIQRVVAYNNEQHVIVLEDLSPEITTKKLPLYQGISEKNKANESSRLDYSSLNISSGSLPKFADFNKDLYSNSSSDNRPSSSDLPYSPLENNKDLQFSTFPNNLNNSEEVLTSKRTLREVTDELERKMILETLKQTRYNISQTARNLALSRRGLKMKMEQLGINVNERP